MRPSWSGDIRWRREPGTLRVFGWVNHGTMGSYAAALAHARHDTELSRYHAHARRANQSRRRDQRRASDHRLTSACSRASAGVPGWMKFSVEPNATASLSLGGVLKGTRGGGRTMMSVVSGVIGGLSPVARAYFAAGGLGILIGDGQSQLPHRTRARGLLRVRAQEMADGQSRLSVRRQPGVQCRPGARSVLALRVHTSF